MIKETLLRPGFIAKGKSPAVSKTLNGDEKKTHLSSNNFIVKGLGFNSSTNNSRVLADKDHMLNGYKNERRLKTNVSEKTLNILDEYTVCESPNAFFQKIPRDQISEITKIMDGELARLFSLVKLMDGFLEAAN